MKKLTMSEKIYGGGFNACGFVTGIMCQSTALLLFSGVYAPIAAATGVGCILGIYGGCSNK